MDRLLKPEQAAELMVVSARTVKKWLREGKLRGLKVGGMWRLTESEVRRFIYGDEGGNISGEEGERVGEKKAGIHDEEHWRVGW